MMRELVALKHIRRHEGCEYQPGECLYASDVDAKYLIKHGYARVGEVKQPRKTVEVARFVPAPTPAIFTPPPPASTVIRRRGRPPRASVVDSAPSDDSRAE